LNKPQNPKTPKPQQNENIIKIYLSKILLLIS